MELAGLAGAGAGWWQAARLALAAGSVSGLIAAGAGFLEYAVVARQPALAGPVERHMILAALAWTCFTANWLWREALSPTVTPGPGWPAPALAGLSLLGFVLLLLAGHAGARLVYVHGLGQERDRHD